MAKKLIIALCLIALLVAATGPVVAQNGDADMTVEEFVTAVRTELNKDKIAIIGAAMSFDGDEAAAFWPLYKAYETSRDALGVKRLALIKDYAENYQMMTDDAAGGLLGRAIALDGERTALRNAFVKKLSKDMSPIVGARFYQVENQLNLIIDLQLAQNLPLMAKGQ